MALTHAKDNPLMDALAKYDTCTVDGCERPHSAKGLCNPHIVQLRRGNELEPFSAPKTRRMKNDPGCSFPECDRPHKSKGLCAPHYHQQWRGEDLKPLKSRDRGRYGAQTAHLPVSLRLETCSTRDDSIGCLIWSRGTNEDGYGKINIKGRAHLAHRVSYELFVGAISEGLVIDHVCGIRSCIEPSHLRAVTRGQNTQYKPGMSGGKTTASGRLGVHWNESSGYWQAKFYLGGECEFVGSFTTVEEANRAVRARRDEVCNMGDPETNRQALRQAWLDRRDDPELLSPFK